MKRLVPIMAALLAASLSACDSSASRVCVTAMAPWIRLPAVPGRPGAGYFEIEARPEQGDLRSVTSPRIARIEMHETASANGVTSMRRIERLAADGCNRFATASSRHLMLLGLDPSIRPGDDVPLTFHFERGPPLTLHATARGAGED
jgi:periplasmic copper chaperone A